MLVGNHLGELRTGCCVNVSTSFAVANMPGLMVVSRSSRIKPFNLIITLLLFKTSFELTFNLSHYCVGCWYPRVHPQH
jgi:hypothetical protein